MNVQDFTHLLQNPNEIVSSKQTKELEDVISEYPYFQTARAIHLKGLKNLNSFKYNNSLKIAAAYTTDRNILFDFITSEYFSQNKIADTILGKTEILNEKPTKKSLSQNTSGTEKILKPKFSENQNLEINNTYKAKKTPEETLEIGKPLSFNKNEKFSFSQWLQLTSQKPLKRIQSNKNEKNVLETNLLKKQTTRNKKFERIDTFIANNPKIIPKETAPKTTIKVSTKLDKNELMTETLAKVYLEQKKYKQAIQAYKILSLKYPKKSSFFASRIKAIEKIQQDNTK